MRRLKTRSLSIRTAIQLGVSLLILVLLFRDTQISNPVELLSSMSLPWLALAVLVKTSALLVHEYRLWLALPKPRPPVRKVISIGLAAGVLNLVLPARGGDVAAIAVLKRECNVAPSVGTTAVAITSFLEAALFGFFLIGVLSLGAAHWAQLFGEDTRHSAVLWISTCVGLGCLGLGLLAAFAARWKPQHSHPFLKFVANTITETARVLRDGRYLGIQVGAAVVQVGLVVTAFSLAVLAAGANIADPIMAGSIVLAVSSFTAFVLPPTMAAGPAAASALVLPQFGESPETALAYAATYWFVAHLPAMSMGLPCLWARMEMAAEE